MSGSYEVHSAVLVGIDFPYSSIQEVILQLNILFFSEQFQSRSDDVLNHGLHHS
jgi:hypothetical protein